MRLTKLSTALIFLANIFVQCTFAADNHSADHSNTGAAIDASDPTKIYTFAGIGVKYTDYSNNEHMSEIRFSANIGFGEKDMLIMETGYGEHSGNKIDGKNSGRTDSRLRWFHLFEMADIPSGYRGMATQVDLALAGEIIGTDGQIRCELNSYLLFCLSLVVFIYNRKVALV
jgi:hypothetical protein